MKIAIFAAVLFLSSGVVLLTGCGGSSPSETDKSTSQQPSDTSLQTSVAKPHRLVGVWLGVAYIEEGKLKTKLDQTLDQTAKQNLLSQAQTFQSMLVGADFQPDGSFTLDAEITPYGGQPARDQSAGQWVIDSEVDEMVMVKAIENGADGAQEESFKQYTFVDDDHFVWIPSLSVDLQECDAMIVFERQVQSEEVAGQSDATVESR